MTVPTRGRLPALWTACCVAACLVGPALAAPDLAAVVVCPSAAGFPERLAAHEIRRYVYLRTGSLLPIVPSVPRRGDSITLVVDPALSPQAYAFQTAARAGGKALTVSGGSGIGVLYGAYAFAEKLGVRFYVHGDVIPDAKVCQRRSGS